MQSKMLEFHLSNMYTNYSRVIDIQSVPESWQNGDVRDARFASLLLYFYSIHYIHN